VALADFLGSVATLVPVMDWGGSDVAIGPKYDYWQR